MSHSRVCNKYIIDSTDADDQSSRHCVDTSTGVPRLYNEMWTVEEGVQIHQRKQANLDGMKRYGVGEGIILS